VTRKVKRFAEGGITGPDQLPIMPSLAKSINTLPFNKTEVSPAPSGGNAMESLNQIMTGSQGVSRALQSIQGAIGGNSPVSGYTEPDFVYHTQNFKKGGKVKSASSRGDGIAKRGKTKGRMV